MKNIPIGLIYSRLIIGFILLILSLLEIENLKFYTVSLLTIGLLTDIFDGIIARKLNISSEKLRRLDSTIDQLFFICVIAATYIQSPQFFKENALLFFILIATEALTYLKELKVHHKNFNEDDEKECRSAKYILSLGPAAILQAKKVVQSVVDADSAPAKVQTYANVINTQLSSDADQLLQQLNANPGLWIRLHPNTKSFVLPNLGL